MILVYFLLGVLIVFCIYLLCMFRGIMREIVTIKADIERHKDSIVRLVKNNESLFTVIDRMRDEIEDLQRE